KRVLIDKIAILKGEIEYKDEAAGGEPILLKPVDLVVSSIQLSDPDQPIRILFQTVFQKIKFGFEAGLWLNLREEKIRLGEGKFFAGSGKLLLETTIEQFMGKDPRINAKLQAPSFDMRDLLPLIGLPPEVAIKENPQFELSVQGSTMDPEVNGRLHVGKISYNNAYDFTDLDIEFGYKKGEATLKHLTGALLDGRLLTTGTVGLGKTMPYMVSVDLANLDINKGTTVASGRGSLKVEANGEGLDQPSIEKNLKAKGLLTLADGKIHSLNLVRSVFSQQITGTIQTALGGRSDIVELPGQKEEGTAYKTITIPFTIENGKLLIEEMTLDHSGYRGTMSGSIGLDMMANLTGRFFLPPGTTDQLIPNSKVREYIA
ncbi:MAG: AsmA-like C-terminal region-containing protein, partial [bacterium]|nr:AsmA-like C-terminal region-containing protein [bacterium]